MVRNLVGGIFPHFFPAFPYYIYKYDCYRISALMTSRHTLQLRIYTGILGAVLLSGMIGLVYFEHFSSLDALYFIVSTISTVGFGDLHPATVAGKILVILIILTGVGCFVGLVANSIELFIDKNEERVRLEKLNMIIGAFFLLLG